MKAAVAYISFFDNKIEQVVIDVETESWKEAFNAALNAGLIERDSSMVEWLLGMPDDLEEARMQMDDGEMDISVVFYECE